MFCLNLCEILNAALLKNDVLGRMINRIVEKNEIKDPLERIYVGSSFCSQYFLHIACWRDIIEYCREREYKMTLTLPIFSEKDLEIGKARIDQILRIGDDVIDEITVNDVGMLVYIPDKYEKNINLGRLFFKDSRDVRVPGYRESAVRPNLLSKKEYMMMGTERVKGVELDAVSRYIDLRDCDFSGITLGIHGPFCFMTTGNICKYASIPKEPDQKFRPNGTCSMECLQVYEHYKEKFGGQNTDILRYGRTVYYYNNGSRVAGKKIDRKIYFPVLEMKRIMKEGVER